MRGVLAEYPLCDMVFDTLYAKTSISSAVFIRVNGLGYNILGVTGNKDQNGLAEKIGLVYFL